MPAVARDMPGRVLQLLGLAGVALAVAADHVLGGEPGFGRGQVVLLGGSLALVAVGAFAPRAWRRRLALLWVAGTVGLGIAEGALQLFMAPHLTSVHRLDPERLHRLEPGAERVFRHRPDNGGGAIHIRVNADGFRGSELDPRPQRRVAVFGDSFVEAEFSTEEATYVARLAAHLGAALSAGVEGVNAGVIAYGPDQAIAHMAGALPRLEPDLVVLVVFAGNDFGDLLRNKLWRLGPSGDLEAHAPVVGPRVVSELQAGASRFLVGKLLRKVWRRAIVPGESPPPPGVTLAEARVDRWLADRVEEHRQWAIERDPVVRNLFRDEHDADLTLEPTSPSATYKIALMEQVLQRAVTVAGGVPLVFVFVPSPVDLADGQAPGNTYDHAQPDRARYPRYDPTAATSALSAMARRHGWPHVDLWDPFRERGVEALYLAGGDDHWSDVGQDLAARLTVEAIVAAGLMAPSPPPRPRARETPD